MLIVELNVNVSGLLDYCFLCCCLLRISLIVSDSVEADIEVVSCRKEYGI